MHLRDCGFNTVPPSLHSTLIKWSKNWWGLLWMFSKNKEFFQCSLVVLSTYVDGTIGSVHNIYNWIHAFLFACCYTTMLALLWLLHAFVHTRILCLNLHEALMYGFKWCVALLQHFKDGKPFAQYPYPVPFHVRPVERWKQIKRGPSENAYRYVHCFILYIF